MTRLSVAVNAMPGDEPEATLSDGLGQDDPVQEAVAGRRGP